MSLHTAAQHLASKGRNGDSTLVHMTPGEVQSLQTIAKAHGGSLTINPATGLAEANFLKSLLPMIAGAALSPFITPMGAAAVVGGFEGIRSKDVGKGLLAGLGAFGGANLAGSLSAAAVPNAAPGFAQTATGLNVIPSEAVSMGATTTPTTFANMSSGAQNLYNTPGGMTDFLGSNKMNLAMSAAPGVSDAMTPKPIDEIAPEKSSGRYLASDFEGYDPRRPNPYYSPMGLGYAAQGGMMPNDLAYAEGGGVKKKEEAALPQPKSELMQNMFKGLSGQPGLKAYQVTDPISQALPYMMGAKMRSIMGEELQDKMAGMFGPPTAPVVGNVMGYEIDPRTGQVYTPRGLGYGGYAEGGMIDPMQRMPNGGLAALQGMRDGYGASQTMDGNIPQMADGGSIGGYSDGGRMLKGPGDGMSDSIPATIGNRQPARLADGEFVVPADVVSHLGNGSTDAGAKKLYGMMDKIRKARTGTKKQGKQIKPEKYMPA
jgi:hypothetical protein